MVLYGQQFNERILLNRQMRSSICSFRSWREIWQHRVCQFLPNIITTHSIRIDNIPASTSNHRDSGGNLRGYQSDRDNVLVICWRMSFLVFFSSLTPAHPSITDHLLLSWLIQRTILRFFLRSWLKHDLVFCPITIVVGIYPMDGESSLPSTNIAIPLLFHTMMTMTMKIKTNRMPVCLRE